MGAWATTSTIYLGSSATIKNNGTYGGFNDLGWRGTVTVAPITLTGCISGSSGYIDAGLSYGSQTLTLSVPSGLTISSYTIGLKLTGSTIACTAEGVELNNTTSQTVSGSDINAQSASVAFSSITEDGNKECIIEITDLSVVVDGIAETFTQEINAANGTFYSGNTVKTPGADVQSVNRWVSNSAPQIKLVTSAVVTNGESHQWGNNIPIDNVNGMRLHSDTYTLSVPDRYRIKGYVITGYTGVGKVYTIKPEGQTAKSISTDSSKPTTIYVDGLNTTSTTFVVGGSSTGNPWIYITSFRVAVEDLLPITNTVLDKLANISVYNSAATSTKTAISSLTTLAEIESVVNDAFNFNVSFKNKLTTTAYLATTGANIVGSAFSTDAAWHLKGYDATAGTFKVYNAAHETYLAQLPSADYTPATATTNSSNAGNWTIDTSAGYILFTMPSVSSSHSALHYSNGNAVRWGTDADASKWTVEKVCELTYNHYKVSDAANPSTEGATLLASSTNYYISGTEIEYADPFDGLSPVTALNSKPTNGAISSDVVVNYYYEQDATLPFVTSTITNGELDNPTWYYMLVNGLATYASGDRMVVDGSQTGLNYERWCFVGDAIYGVQIFAESKGVAYPLNIASMANNDNVRITSTSTNSHWFVSGSDLSNLVFYQKSGNTTFALNQLGGASGGGGWSWKVGLWSSGSTVKLYAASENMPDAWALEAINHIPTQTVYTNANTIGWPSSTARGTLDAAIAAFGQETSYANYSALLSAWNTYQTTTDITTPPAGFYRIKSVSAWESAPDKYLVGTNSSVNSQRAAYDGSAGSSTSSIWYYTGTSLINYGNGGYYLIIDNSNNIGNASSVVAGAPVTFTKANSSNEWETFNIKINNARWLYTQVKDGTDYYYTDSGSGTPSAVGYRFNVEEVTTLPVTLTDIDNHGFASFYTPVGISSLPEGVKAYIATISGTRVQFTEISDIPANTGVILYMPECTANTTVNLTIGEASSSTEGNILTGVTATTTLGDQNVMTMQNGSNGLGFYKYNGTNLNGFKVYIEITSAMSGVKSFVFDFDDDATGINSIDNEQLTIDNAIYNVAGQRLNKMQKGINIVNGKKILK